MIYADPGQTRLESVQNGFAKTALQAQTVAVHDGARPLVNPAAIEACLQTAAQYGAAVLAVPVKDTVKAFVIGGTICAFGQALQYLYVAVGMDKEIAPVMVSVTLILISVVMTGLGLYDSVARHAGAGTLVPITGFANAVVSPAIDNKAEGLVLGLGVKLFSVAGPVILFGTLSSVVYGIYYYVMKLMGV